jgi:hypothetical protein
MPAFTKKQFDDSKLLGRIFIFDDMLAGAVEFVDGWYSNMYDVGAMRLVLVRVCQNNLQLGLANVAPNSVDVVTVFETDCCGEEQLVNTVAQSLAQHIQHKVRTFSHSAICPNTPFSTYG